MFPGEPPVITRYGQNWNFSCRIRASDTLYVDPGAEGERDESEYSADLDIDFSLEMFTKPTFQQADIFADGDMIDIGVNSTEKQVIYVQAKASIKSGDSADYMLHIKGCKVDRTETINGTEQQLNHFVFLLDGCITPGNHFANHTFKIKPHRVQWSNNNEKTIVVDQFSADLWDPEINMDASIEAQSYRFKCNLVVCEIDAFQRTFLFNSICKHGQCSRYGNLFSSVGRKRRSQDEEIIEDEMKKYGRSDVFQAEGGLKVNILKDAKASTTTTATARTTTEPVTGGTPYYGLVPFLIIFVTLL